MRPHHPYSRHCLPPALSFFCTLKDSDALHLLLDEPPNEQGFSFLICSAYWQLMLLHACSWSLEQIICAWRIHGYVVIWVLACHCGNHTVIVNLIVESDLQCTSFEEQLLNELVEEIMLQANAPSALMNTVSEHLHVSRSIYLFINTWHANWKSLSSLLRTFLMNPS